MDKTHKIIWEAFDHIEEEKSSDWYWIIGIIAIGISFLSIYFGNILFAILIVVSAGILMIQAKNPPRIIEFELNRKGVRVGEIFYPYENLYSFYIIDEDGYERDRIIIKSTKTFMPYIVLPIGNAVDQEVIREFLHEYLHEEALQESSLYKIVKNLGL